MLRVLIVKIGAIGDVVFTMPMLNAIHEVEPRSHVSWLVGESCADLIRGHAHLNKLYILSDKDLYSKSVMSRMSVVRDIFGKLERTYDLILIGHRDPGYAFALRPFVWGPYFQLAREEGGSQIRHTVYVPPMKVHESLAMRQLLEAGLKHARRPTTFKWEEKFDHIYTPAIGLPEEFIVIHAGGGANAKTDFQLKQWPHTTDFIHKILKSTNLSVVVIGGKDDRRDLERSFKDFNQTDEKRVYNLMGETSVRDLVGIIRKARLFVGPDSGPVHIADSLGVPTIGLYGPTSHVSWGLLSPKSRAMYEGAECAPCYKDTGAFPPCDFQHRCMQELRPERVLDQAMILLRPNAK
jgi:heptosyltransferase I